MKQFKMNYLIIAILLLSMMLFVGCSQSTANSKEPINIATLNGPTGLGMVKCMKEGNSLDKIIN